MLNKYQRRIVRIVGFMAKKGIPYNCQCGQKHKIDLSVFEEKDGKLKPRELIKLRCSRFYDSLKDFKSFEIKIEAEMAQDVGIIKSNLGKFYIWLWVKWLNR